jgi:nitric oxide reductase
VAAKGVSSIANNVTVSELLRYIGDLVDKRTQEQKDDLISLLVAEQIKPGKLSKEDAVQMAFLLLVAGNATMVNMISLVSCV